MATLDVDKFMDYPLRDFLLILRAISAQRFGRLFQKYLIHKGYFEDTDSGIGDAFDPDTQTNVEIKVSLPRAGKPFNFVQIRPHETCDLVLFGVDCDGKIHHWRVAHESVQSLVSLFGTSAHGKLDRNDERQEYALRFKPESDLGKYMDKLFVGTGIEWE